MHIFVGLGHRTKDGEPDEEEENSLLHHVWIEKMSIVRSVLESFSNPEKLWRSCARNGREISLKRIVELLFVELLFRMKSEIRTIPF